MVLMDDSDPFPLLSNLELCLLVLIANDFPTAHNSPLPLSVDKEIFSLFLFCCSSFTNLRQIIECKIVLEVFRNCSFSFNLISDSAYVVNAVKALEVAGHIKPNSTVCKLLQVHVTQQPLE
ncbi:putative Pol polyprotein [Cricetulus griseus]|uniref:Putative Pol polyprotein n=1 Tax=Cricetulus griseus TaxID=10029 RepID=A0A061IMK3_CRIGR|nr:putative Pol polyprotein [Cricetulus griseus]